MKTNHITDIPSQTKSLAKQSNKKFFSLQFFKAEYIIHHISIIIVYEHEHEPHQTKLELWQNWTMLVNFDKILCMHRMCIYWSDCCFSEHNNLDETRVLESDKTGKLVLRLGHVIVWSDAFCEQSRKSISASISTCQNVSSVHEMPFGFISLLQFETCTLLISFWGFQYTKIAVLCSQREKSRNWL